VMVSETNTSDTKAILANITDPYMGRMSLRSSLRTPSIRRRFRRGNECADALRRVDALRAE
jgi:hypothetical protein